jgi:molybdopterin adenylyltransferase
MKSGRVLHVCTSEQKGTTKQCVPSITLRPDHGVVGDAHAGDWHRQVSLLDNADIDSMRAKGVDLQPGAFGENIVAEALPLETLGIGSRLALGEAELELSQIGKVCHQRCAIYHRTGDCIMPRLGVFAEVVRGGEVAPGTQIDVSLAVPRETIQIAVITVSDSRAAGLAEDTAGPAVAQSVAEGLQARIAQERIIPDEPDVIRTALIDGADRGLDLLLTVGGTGFGPRDHTPEATRDVTEREAPGLAEAMRATSRESTPYAMLQRGICGLRGRSLIINLPGSERGSIENLAAVLPVLPHAVRLARGLTDH